MSYIRALADCELESKTVLVRTDLNVPVHEGEITSQARIHAAIPTFNAVLDGGGSLIICSHLGRPQPGDTEPSLAIVEAALRELLDRQVVLVRDWQQHPPEAPNAGEVLLLENIRFAAGETSNDTELAKLLGGMCDLFVMDAFATAHRAHASTCKVVEYAPNACAGLLLQQELQGLNRALNQTRPPVIALVGGSKISTKLELLRSLIKQTDRIIPGGGIANTLLQAAGHDVGASLCEPDLIDTAKELLNSGSVLLPVDVVVRDSAGKARVCGLDEVGPEDAIYDIGPQSTDMVCAELLDAGSIIWNGPLGVFEQSDYATGTRRAAEAIARSSAYSLAGGGDTLAAIDAFGTAEGISCISTGGGAFLQYLQGGSLPAIEALKTQ